MATKCKHSHFCNRVFAIKDHKSNILYLKLRFIPPQKKAKLIFPSLKSSLILPKTTCSQNQVYIAVIDHPSNIPISIKYSLHIAGTPPPPPTPVNDMDFEKFQNSKREGESKNFISGGGGGGGDSVFVKHQKMIHVKENCFFSHVKGHCFLPVNYDSQGGNKICLNFSSLVMSKQC